MVARCCNLLDEAFVLPLFRKKLLGIDTLLSEKWYGVTGGVTEPNLDVIAGSFSFDI